MAVYNKRLCMVLSVSSNSYFFRTATFRPHRWQDLKKIRKPSPNRFGPLTNLPDYSFVDGRPAPLGQNAYKKLKLQESYCKTIMQLSSEMDFAVDRYAKLQEAKKKNIEGIIKNKLKAKGDLLTKENSN